MMRILLFFAVLASLFSFPAFGEQRSPRLAYVYPAGGQRGTSFDVRVGGELLAGAELALFAGSGVRAEIRGFVRPLKSELREQVLDEIRHLDDKRREAAKPVPPIASSPPAGRPVWTDADRLRLEALRGQIGEDDRLRSTPAFSGLVSLRVTIDPQAIPGNHELRLATAQGLSNPIVFVVGDLPEIAAPYRHVSMALSAGGGAPLPTYAHAEAPTQAIKLTLPIVLNGQMIPGAVDRYRFSARKGQMIIASARTRALIPYLSDTVPGWSQLSLSIFDASGREIAAADHDGFRQEALLNLKIPDDGEYVLSVHDLLNRGREDFIYRVELGELPWVSAIFPLGARLGVDARFELDGWNLVSRFLKLDSGIAGIQVLPEGRQKGLVNPLSMEFGDLPERLIRSSPVKPLPIRLPVVLNGRIAKPGESARFVFHARAGEELVVESLARRLGSPLDSRLTIYDMHGVKLVSNDDFADPSFGLLTHQADSRIAFHVPADGSYLLDLSDALSSGGKSYAYRLRVSAPRPDFDVFALPASIQIKRGQSATVEVRLIRRDGFVEPVTLRLADTDSGLRLDGGGIPTGIDSQKIRLSASPQATAGVHPLRIIAEAQGQGRVLRHSVQFVGETVQAFSWKSLVPAQTGMVWIRAEGKR